MVCFPNHITHISANLYEPCESSNSTGTYFWLISYLQIPCYSSLFTSLRSSIINGRRIAFISADKVFMLCYILHLTWIGPPICSFQWTMECMIGSPVGEIRQPSNSYSNLSQCRLLRCQENALTAMILDLQPSKPKLPGGAVDLGNRFALLNARDGYNQPMGIPEACALGQYSDSNNCPNILTICNACWITQEYRQIRTMCWCIKESI